MVICIVASSELIDDDDLLGYLHTFRHTMEYTRDIIISSVHEPDLESNLLITTVVTLGYVFNFDIKNANYIDLNSKFVVHL